MISTVITKCTLLISVVLSQQEQRFNLYLAENIKVEIDAIVKMLFLISSFIYNANQGYE